MAEPRAKDREKVSVTMVGDMASALQIASYQRRSYGDDNCEVTGLVEEAVSDWLHKEIYGPTPVAEAPDPDPEQPVEATVPATGRKLVPMMALGLVLLGVIGWSLVRINERVTDVPSPPPVVAEPVAIAPVATGVLIIDAQPWAEVERVLDPSGVEVALPDDRYTPLRLELPAGRYSVRLIRPESPMAQNCVAQVADSATVRCMPQQTEIGAADLFKETGWWQ